jgi:hypothetical protein
VAALNDGPAIVVRSEGRAVAAVILDIFDGRIERLYLVGTPEKLERIDRPARA